MARICIAAKLCACQFIYKQSIYRYIIISHSKQNYAHSAV